MINCEMVRNDLMMMSHTYVCYSVHSRFQGSYPKKIIIGHLNIFYYVKCRMKYMGNFAIYL